MSRLLDCKLLLHKITSIYYYPELFTFTSSVKARQNIDKFDMKPKILFVNEQGMSICAINTLLLHSGKEDGLEHEMNERKK